MTVRLLFAGRVEIPSQQLDLTSGELRADQGRLVDRSLEAQ